MGKNTDVEGEIKELQNPQRKILAEGITLSVSGNSPKEGFPSISIADNGEGQSPKELLHTILALKGSNKADIKFTHGKFNMGGTASLRFCGVNNIQFVLSKRHPGLLEDNSSENESNWGFTIVPRAGCTKKVVVQISGSHWN